MNNQKPNSRMHYGLKTMASLCRGNTLVPIIIALSISSVASIAFLKQGADLSEKQKQINAPDEVLGIVEEFVQLNSSKNYANIVASDLTFPGTRNVYNLPIFFTQSIGPRPAYVRYPTRNPNTCNNLRTVIEKYQLVVDVQCGNFMLVCNNKDLCIEFKGM